MLSLALSLLTILRICKTLQGNGRSRRESGFEAPTYLLQDTFVGKDGTIRSLQVTVVEQKHRGTRNKGPALTLTRHQQISPRPQHNLDTPSIIEKPSIMYKVSASAEPNSWANRRNSDFNSRHEKRSVDHGHCSSVKVSLFNTHQ